MQYASGLLLIFAFVIDLPRSARRTKEKKTSNTKPDAGGIVIQPSRVKSQQGDRSRSRFQWRWSRQIGSMSANQASAVCKRTENRGHVSLEKPDGRRVHGQRRRRRRASSVDARSETEGRDGQTVHVPDWSAEFTRRSFRSRSISGNASDSARPQIYSRIHLRVQLTEVAEHVYFQDRDSHARFPVEVIQSTEEKNQSAGGENRFESRRESAAGRSHVRSRRQWLESTRRGDGRFAI